jgi:hypothetical protein
MVASRFTSRPIRLALLALMTCLFAGFASAADRQLEARLIWGTNDDKSPNPAHKRLEGDLARKLQELPFKWKSYFEVNRQTFAINDKEYKKVVMSDKCFIEVKDKGDSKVTVKLYGQGKMTQRVDKPLPKDETLTIGGDDKHDTAWFITVRPIDAPAAKPAVTGTVKK